MTTTNTPTNFDIVSDYVRLSHEASSALGTEENLKLGVFLKNNEEKLIAIEFEAKKDQHEWAKLSPESKQELMAAAAARLDGDPKKYIVDEGIITELNSRL